ncbi:hypothetical protein O181_032329 [Austropuccinia psidii MF-1]|uniref:glucan 1,4-alpha-glucosidase n=1 Tax=Austropuccinia psidii MF-1 TaxID=1389203 RepID=A0A9Q3CWK8_9BASI|nr:hypothetical protein [Austropuccinia psidii MF-1]
MQTISASQVIQSSAVEYLDNVGEPKYEVNGTVFTGLWYRPQNDGPALRATVYMKFASVYRKFEGEKASEFIKNVLYANSNGTWGLIKSKSIQFSVTKTELALHFEDLKFPSSVVSADLEYIANHWQDISFDLWEEVRGHHFFTFSMIYRALREGSSFARQMNDTGAASWYQNQADKVADQLELFWDTKAGYIITGRDLIYTYDKISGLDAGTILAFLHAGTYIPKDLRLGSLKTMKTFQALLNASSSIYPLNPKYQNYTAKPIGRYPEDAYNGTQRGYGNPWFLTTLAMSEYLYRLPSLAGSERFIYQNVGLSAKKVADEFLTIVCQSASINGSLHEEFDRNFGSGVGARDLTWSHVAFLSMNRARSGLPEF